MRGDQYKDFETIMARAALLTFQQRGKDWRDLVTAMFEELAAYELEDVRTAVAAHVRARKFFPTLSDIITRIDGLPEDRAAVAWQTVVRAIRRLGHYVSVRFQSPAYHYAIAQMGGWQELCSSLRIEELPFRGKDFERFFQIGERVATWGNEAGKVHVPSYLMGGHEANNRRGGFALLPDVVDAKTGEPLRGFRGELPEPGESSGIVMRLVKGMRAG
jgi:hypothetical protein